MGRWRNFYCRDALGRWHPSRSSAQCPYGNRPVDGGGHYMCMYNRGHVEPHQVDPHFKHPPGGFTGRWTHVWNRQVQMLDAHTSGCRRRRRKLGRCARPVTL